MTDMVLLCNLLHFPCCMTIDQSGTVKDWCILHELLHTSTIPQILRIVSYSYEYLGMSTIREQNQVHVLLLLLEVKKLNLNDQFTNII